MAQCNGFFSLLRCYLKLILHTVTFVRQMAMSALMSSFPQCIQLEKTTIVFKIVGYTVVTISLVYWSGGADFIIVNLNIRWEDFSLKKKIQKILVVSNITCRTKLPVPIVSARVIRIFPNLLTRFYWRSHIKINVVKISVLDSILRLIPRPPGSGSGSFPLPDANYKKYFFKFHG